MSEKIYARLLRLFPSRFRESYGEDALQLFRDRARDETGIFARIRLWLDLLADLVISVPREYFYAQPELLSASAQRHMGGLPSFYILGNDAPRPGALVFGSALSLLALATFSALLSHGAMRRALHSSRDQGRPPYARSAASERSPAAARSADDRHLVGSSESAATIPDRHAGSAAPAGPSEAGQGDLRSSAVLRPAGSASEELQPAQPSVASSPSQTGTSSPVAASAAGDAGDRLAADERHRVVNAAASNLKHFYVDPVVGQQTSDALLAHESRGDDNAASDGAAFAVLLTRQMRDVSHDLHLDMVYSRDPLPDQLQPPSLEDLARYRQAVQRENCGFEKIEILSHNIGYLKLNAFPDPAFCQATAAAAMNKLNRADALIFDLRDNRGGQPEMVAFMASYFFDHPTYFYNPRENTTQKSWTASPVPGNQLANKPLFVLTSSSTFSGAEQFCFNMKMLKRATLVGETTGGASHAGVFHRIDDHFGMGIPEVKPVNPYSNVDWAGVGVKPDVPVNAADALKTAQELAAAKLLRH